MRDLPDVKLFSSDLIDDMHKAFEAVCSNLGLKQSDRATESITTKIVELAKAGRRGADLRNDALRFFEGPAARVTQDRPTAAHDAGGGDRTTSKSIPIERLNASNDE
jgi:hypothetical protein